MDFASKYILAIDEDEYESVSDEEFEQGMNISDSASNSDSDDEAKRGRRDDNSGHSSPKKKKFLKNRHHWRHKHQPQEETEEKDVKERLAINEGKIPSKRRFRRADTNVVSVNFNTLLAPGNMHAGEPVMCTKCSAILSHISKVVLEKKEWQCEFCDEVISVDIDPEEIPTSEDVTYLIEPAMTTATSTMSGLDQSLVIFCVDTSGSMCVTTEISGSIKLRGTSQLKRLESFIETDEVDQRLPSQRGHSVTYISRLQAMQAAVDHQLGEMCKNHPNRRVALITFNNEVTIVGDGSQRETIVSGDKLKSEEELSKIGSEAPLPQAIKCSRRTLGEKVYNLEEGGATALGPALIVAVNMAAHHPGSKVILCTDGKANIGLGKLEDTSEEQEALDFYTRTAESAFAKGVTVSVITIEGTDCKLVHVGMLADKTGGQVNIVDPLKLTEEFGNILADPIIATRVKAFFIVHNELYVLDENDPDSKLSRAEHNAGNVKSSSTITFEFAKRKQARDLPSPHDSSTGESQFSKSDKSDMPREGVDVQQHCPINAPVVEEHEDSLKVTDTDAARNFPFQLQIEYTDTEGNKALRVLTRTMPATHDRKVTEKNANLEVLGAHAAKKSADLALKGQFSKSRGLALMNQRLAWRNTHSDTASTMDRTKYKVIFSKIQSMENFLQKKQKQEIVQFGHTRSDSEHSDTDDLYEDGQAPSAQAPVPPRTYTKGYIATKFKKMHSERASDMEDSMANMMYRLRSVGADEISAPEPGDKILALPSSSSDKQDKKSGKGKRK